MAKQQQQQQQGRRLSVPYNSNINASAGRRVSVRHAAMAGADAGAGGSNSGGSNTSADVNILNGGAGTAEKSALTQRKASLMLPNSNETRSGTVEKGLPVGRALSDTSIAHTRPSDCGGEAAAAAALGLALQASKGRHGSLAPTREDTFDAAAGRFPLQQS